MEACDLPIRSGASAEALRGAVVAMRDAGLSVVVVAPRGEARGLRELLGSEVYLVPLAPETSVDAAGRGVFPVPGRCVVVARREEQGWDFLATPGAVPPAPEPRPADGEAPPAVVDAVERAPPRIPSLTGGLWVGAGLRTGYPALATPMYSLLAGPVVAEAGRTWLLGSVWRDRWWHVGAMAPISRSEERAVTAGVVWGHRSLRIAGYDTRSGPMLRVQAELAWRVPDEAHVAAFANVAIGGDAAITRYAHLRGEHVDLYPVVEVSVGTRLGP